MNRQFKLTSLILFLLLALIPVSEVNAFVEKGSLVKGSSPTLYYYASDGSRYVFINEGVFFSWFKGFNNVKTISDQELGAMPLKGNITYRPGIRLVKIQSDPHIYAVDKFSVLHWIESESVAVALYGTDWNRNVDDIPDSMFFNYTIGTSINDVSKFNPQAIADEINIIDENLGLLPAPGASLSDTVVGRISYVNQLSDLLPDLIPLAPYDLSYDMLNGRKILRFSATFWNSGDAALELSAAAGLNSQDEVVTTYQRILQKDGLARQVEVGNFMWHGVHDHYHYTNFADYLLFPATSHDLSATPIVTQKSTFCMRDDFLIDKILPGAPTSRIYTVCGKNRQGVSVGWADYYPSTLPDQFIDVDGLAPGIYRLSFNIDPLHRFQEKSIANNVSATILELNPASGIARVIASGAPYTTIKNQFPDGMLIRSEDDLNVYIIKNGVKILQKTSGTLFSDAYLEENTVILPQSIVDIIPNLVTPIPDVEVVADNLVVPWDIVFLPDGDMLVTERPGTLRRIGAHPAVIDIPAVRHTGEGGLMGIALHPNFILNNFVYLYFTTDKEGQFNRIARFRFEGNQLIEDKIILDNIPSAIYHDGGQIAFGPDGMLYVTTGDASTPDLSQNLSSLGGKTLRITPEGAIPADNPFGTTIWSYGHRNAQGITWDAQGRMWQTEHGRSGAVSGFDELNLVEKGKNYGWPVIEGSEIKPGMVTPKLNSTADYTWAPSGIAYINNRIFFAGLRGSELYSVTVNDQGEIGPLKKYFSGVYGRMRAVVVGPDGFLYVTTSNRDGRGTVRSADDKILRIHPDLLK